MEATLQGLAPYPAAGRAGGGTGDASVRGKPHIT